MCREEFKDQEAYMKHLQHFQDATQDFVDFQHLDYASAFRCACGAKNLTGDGISISFPASKACFEAPWLAHEDDDLVSGSLFAERLLVKQPAVRKLLAKFASFQRSMGLDAEELECLRNSVELLGPDEPAHSLLPFLQHAVDSGIGIFHPPKPWRHSLHALATPAPACQLLPQVTHAAVEEYLLSGAISPPAWSVIMRHSPVLYAFLFDVINVQPLASNGVVVHVVAVKTFIAALLEVSLPRQLEFTLKIWKPNRRSRTIMAILARLLSSVSGKTGRATLLAYRYLVAAFVHSTLIKICIKFSSKYGSFIWLVRIFLTGSFSIGQYHICSLRQRNLCLLITAWPCAGVTTRICPNHQCSWGEAAAVSSTEAGYTE